MLRPHAAGKTLPAHLQRAGIVLAVIRVTPFAKWVHHVRDTGSTLRLRQLSLEAAYSLLQLGHHGAAARVHIHHWGAHVAGAQQLGADAAIELDELVHGRSGMGMGRIQGGSASVRPPSSAPLHS